MTTPTTQQGAPLFASNDDDDKAPLDVNNNNNNEVDDLMASLVANHHHHQQQQQHAGQEHQQQADEIPLVVCTARIMYSFFLAAFESWNWNTNDTFLLFHRYHTMPTDTSRCHGTNGTPQ